MHEITNVFVRCESRRQERLLNGRLTHRAEGNVRLRGELVDARYGSDRLNGGEKRRQIGRVRRRGDEHEGEEAGEDDSHGQVGAVGAPSQARAEEKPQRVVETLSKRNAGTIEIVG